MNRANTNLIGATILAIVVVGSYYNSQQISQLKPVVLDHDLPSPSRRVNWNENGRKTKANKNEGESGTGANRWQGASCLKARKDTVTPSLFGKLPRPFINLGFPKMGTSSLHAFFKCGGLKSHHFQCGKDLTTKRTVSCAKCVTNSIASNQPPFSTCDKADIYTQIDNGTYFPQIEALNELHEGYPQATFFITFRNMSKWFHSLSHWPPRPRGPHMDERLRKYNITGFPSGKGKNEDEFTEWFCNHVSRVRELVDNSDHHLVEVDIEDETIAQRMGEMFSINEGCWGHANVNLNIHPDANASEVVLSRKFLKAENSPVEGGDEEDDNTYEKEDGAYEEDDNRENVEYDDESAENDVVSSDASCFHARNDTISPSMYQKLPKPFINLGFPKMGTTSLDKYFKCGKLVSHHYFCNIKQRLTCSKCIKQSVHKGEAPLSQCPKGAAYTQLDDGKFFPQIDFLENFLNGYPQATFILMFRGMEKWYHSLENWPPNRTKYQPLTKRYLDLDIAGLSNEKGDAFSAFSDWHCGHINRVREMMKKYPSHSLVEIDIEDPHAGEYLEKLFGIKESCFGRHNVNTQLS